MSHTETLIEHQIDLKKLAERGVEIFFQQVFEHNFFHADMHPGNIFVAYDKPDSPQYIAIDCAIMGSLVRTIRSTWQKTCWRFFSATTAALPNFISCGWISADAGA